MKINKLMLTENFFNEPETEWVKKESKMVSDSDGFMTDYTWYTNGEKHIFMFGDEEIYEPDDSYADWEVEIYPGKEEQAEKEAREWFDGYTGYEDEELDESLKENDSDDAIPVNVSELGVEYVIKTDYFGDDYEYLGNWGRSWVTKDSSKIDKFSSRGVAEAKAKEQSRKYKAYVVPTSEIKVEEHPLTEADNKAFNPITLKKYGFTRDPENDFADDGNRFTSYLYKGVIPVTYLKSNGEVYLTIAFHHLRDVSYEEYKHFSSYQDADKYNGVDQYSVDPQDIANICEKAKQEYEEFKKNVKAPDMKEFEAYRKRYADAYREVAQKARQLIVDNIDSIPTLRDYDIQEIFRYYKNILDYVTRYTKPYTGSETYIRSVLTPDGLQKQKKELDDIENFYYFKQIKELIPKTKTESLLKESTTYNPAETGEKFIISKNGVPLDFWHPNDLANPSGSLRNIITFSNNSYMTFSDEGEAKDMLSTIKRDILDPSNVERWSKSYPATKEKLLSLLSNLKVTKIKGAMIHEDCEAADTLEESTIHDSYNKFEKETDVEFLKDSLSEMRRYERNWNYEGKKNAGCTLTELRQLIKFAEKRLQEL